MSGSISERMYKRGTAGARIVELAEKYNAEYKRRTGSGLGVGHEEALLRGVIAYLNEKHTSTHNVGNVCSCGLQRNSNRDSEGPREASSCVR